MDDPPIILVSADGEVITAPACLAEYSAVIRDVVASNPGKPIPTTIPTQHLHGILQFVNHSVAELEAAELRLATAVVHKVETSAAAAKTVEPLETSGKELRIKDSIQYKLRMEGTCEADEDIVRMVRRVHASAYAATDVDSIGRFLEMVYKFEFVGAYSDYNKETWDDMRVRTKKAVVDALVTHGDVRQSALSVLDQILSVLEPRLAASSALRAEYSRLYSAWAEAMHAKEAAAAEHAAAEAALRALQVDLQLRPSPAVRSVVEGKSLVSILRLARASDLLAVEKLMDLCGIAVSSFCSEYPESFCSENPECLRRDIVGDGGIRWEWDAQYAFAAPATLKVLDEVCVEVGVDYDACAGLVAVSKHISLKMYPRRIAMI